ncbi:uncharacterized protein EV420DRAFT_1481033 [Desarmillaria tabescens]|uniref:Uncharacterized protein n=1 Tax=Armillaria tabescens TaxID=1929756 RepID=A0AA39N4J7_ARMTA|nr:uncharacterized protein EV420DRAFT_1481033 [Desarmillaria tabescens]KAK0457174.1 hypothetical protein EV420DRAFT_1481033 [Desarmillaria tabescens]
MSGTLYICWSFLPAHSGACSRRILRVAESLLVLPTGGAGMGEERVTIARAGRVSLQSLPVVLNGTQRILEPKYYSPEKMCCLVSGKSQVVLSICRRRKSVEGGDAAGESSQVRMKVRSSRQKLSVLVAAHIVSNAFPFHTSRQFEEEWIGWLMEVKAEYAVILSGRCECDQRDKDDTAGKNKFIDTMPALDLDYWYCTSKHECRKCGPDAVLTPRRSLEMEKHLVTRMLTGRPLVRPTPTQHFPFSIRSLLRPAFWDEKHYDQNGMLGQLRVKQSSRHASVLNNDHLFSFSLPCSFISFVPHDILNCWVTSCGSFKIKTGNPDFPSTKRRTSSMEGGGLSAREMLKGGYYYQEMQYYDLRRKSSRVVNGALLDDEDQYTVTHPKY